MILQSLIRLAEQERLLPDPGFWREDVSWVVVIDADGQVVRVDGPPVHTPPAEGKRKPKTIELSRWCWVPAVDKNNPGMVPDSVIAKAERMFGWIEAGKAKDKALADARTKRTKQQELIRAIAQRCADDPGMKAWLAALDHIAANPLVLATASGLASHELRKPIEHRCSLTGQTFTMAQVQSDLFAFRLDGDVDLIVQRPAVRAALAAWAQDRDASLSSGSCLLSGRQGPLADKHPQVLLFPGSWVSLVSCSAEHKAFAHYERSDLGNSPVNLTAARQVAIATARLVSEGDFVPPGGGQPLAKRHLRLPGDTLVLYWCQATGPDPLDDPWMQAVIDAQVPDPVQVAAIYTQPWRDGRPLGQVELPFHTLVLGRNNKRVVLRGASTRTIGEVAVAVDRWLKDLQIIKRFDSDRCGLRDLIQATVSPKSSADPAPDLAAHLWLCAIEGTPPPANLLAILLGRIRSHDDGPTEKRKTDQTVSTARVALIKLILIRRHHQEIPVALDPEHPTPAYHLGRLFCLLERIQAESLGDINASIADRFLGSAMTTPSLVFPRLLKLSHHHLGKLAPTNAGRSVNLDKAKDAILARFQSLPRILPLEDQGAFIIGYHHQRAEFFRKKDESGTTQA